MLTKRFRDAKYAGKKGIIKILTIEPVIEINQIND